jgi:alkylation response protein AidB-like acyl-CoA dehydrogenase
MSTAAPERGRAALDSPPSPEPGRVPGSPKDRGPGTSAAPTAEELNAKQIAQAEELLFSGPPKHGFVKALYQGRFRAEAIFPYPEEPPAARAAADQAVDEVRRFLEEHVDPARIDREADIPRSVIEGLGRVGVLGMTAPVEVGGRGLSQSGYCRVMEVIGGHCASTSVFVNAHHSIGIRALLLFGTEEQKSRWLPGLVRGEKLAAFALTEPEAGSDAANVQTTAEPIQTEEGPAYKLNGQKRYITNGGIADVLTVMARTPDPKGGESKITAFLVTPDLPGFRVLEERKPKCGIRGTATGALAFNEMIVPASNVLGPVGKGLRVALTVLDFGRTTFGACCTGVAKVCLKAAVRHASTRRQFGKTLGSFELVKKKIAFIAAHTYAMEATTRHAAALIDSGAEDYMLETGILKVFATEVLWDIVYETLQIHGGQGYFNDEPYERMMRDARINTIGEGANEVLKGYLIALAGMRDLGKEFEAVFRDFTSGSSKFFGGLWGLTKNQARLTIQTPHVPVTRVELLPFAKQLAKRVKRFGWAVQKTIVTAGGPLTDLPGVVKFGKAAEKAMLGHMGKLMDRQMIQERIADAVIALYTASCVLSRLDHELNRGDLTPLNRKAGELFLRMSFRKFDRCLDGLKSNDDPHVVEVADLALAQFQA